MLVILSRNAGNFFRYGQTACLCIRESNASIVNNHIVFLDYLLDLQFAIIISICNRYFNCIDTVIKLIPIAIFSLFLNRIDICMIFIFQ